METDKQLLPSIAISLRGHDKGRIYVLLSEDGGKFLAADGRHSHIDCPKKKSAKHLQRSLSLSEEVSNVLNNIRTDSDIIHAIKTYRKSV